MPVAISPVDGDFQDGSEGGDQFSVLIVDGAAAFEVVIVFGHFEQAFAGGRCGLGGRFENGITSSCFSGPPKLRTSRGVVGVGQHLALQGFV